MLLDSGLGFVGDLYRQIREVFNMVYIAVYSVKYAFVLVYSHGIEGDGNSHNMAVYKGVYMVDIR